MRELRLIGVHDDGEHLVLTSDDGARFRVPIDEPLRAAARRDRPHLGQLQIAIEGGASAKDVQSLIRSGLSAEQVSERTGWTVAKVHKFEGPILAEREHIAGKAQQCAVEPRGDRPTTLISRVEERLQSRGVAPASAGWDSSRDDHGVWTVRLTFTAGGVDKVAAWRYEPLGGSVLPIDDEARWLSEPDSPGPIPTPHVLPGEYSTSVVFDVEADGSVPRSGRHRGSDAPIDLVAALRDHSRARRRRGSAPTTAPPTDALPIEEPVLDPALAPPPPAALDTHPVEAHLDSVDHEARSAGEADSAPGDSASTQANEGADASQAEATDDAQPAPAKRGSRPRVPAWDDIVFGTKGPGPSD